MKQFVVLLTLLIIAMPACADLSANYNIVVQENGNSMVVLVVKGIGTINVPLPLDVKSPAVRGALYVQSTNGVDVSIDAEGTSTIVYKTALLTNRAGKTWDFMLDLPNFSTASIIVAIPSDTDVLSTTPQAAISQVDENKNIIWDIKPESDTSVSAQYIFTEKQGLSAVPGESTKDVVIKVAVLTVLIVLILFGLYVWSRSRKGMLYSSGKQNVLKTLSGNETKIVSMLLQNDGGLQRNRLERESGIPKSSLASALQNLEKKNVLSVDRSYSVHYVELTEWFKKL